ncbi:MAG: hypothetical protein KIS66_16715 [Fimbriimonadaceae bacterium]|nr:hypothetical protein [Fimbriimonadaceae bacterium]
MAIRITECFVRSDLSVMASVVMSLLLDHHIKKPDEPMEVSDLVSAVQKPREAILHALTELSECKMLADLGDPETLDSFTVDALTISVCRQQDALPFDAPTPSPKPRGETGIEHDFVFGVEHRAEIAYDDEGYVLEVFRLEDDDEPRVFVDTYANSDDAWEAWDDFRGAFTKRTVYNVDGAPYVLRRDTDPWTIRNSDDETVFVATSEAETGRWEEVKAWYEAQTAVRPVRSIGVWLRELADAAKRRLDDGPYEGFAVVVVSEDAVNELREEYLLREHDEYLICEEEAVAIRAEDGGLEWPGAFDRNLLVRRAKAFAQSTGSVSLSKLHRRFDLDDATAEWVIGQLIAENVVGFFADGDPDKTCEAIEV